MRVHFTAESGRPVLSARRDKTNDARPITVDIGTAGSTGLSLEVSDTEALRLAGEIAMVLPREELRKLIALCGVALEDVEKKK